MAETTTTTEEVIVGEKETDLQFFNKRLDQLKLHRQSTFHGIKLDKIYKDADKDYQLNRLGDFNTQGNPYKGLNLREQLPRFDLNRNDWQSENTDAAVYAKIQTAMSLMFDRNLVPTLTAGSKKFTATTEFAKAVLMDSQAKEDFKEKIKIFMFNTMKYGTGFGRTFIKETECEYRDIVSIDKVTGKREYKNIEKTKKQVYFKPLNNFNVFIDDCALPNQYDTMNDWFWRELYSDEALMAEFGETQKIKDALVKKPDAGATEANEDKDRLPTPKNEVWFMENRERDLQMVVCNGVEIYNEILPSHKKLSLVYAIWNLRSDLTIHGCGLPEIMRQDKMMLDKIRNMSMDQLALSIYKMFFYDGTIDAEDTDLQIKPGLGQRVIDPSKIKWLEVPGPGQESINREEMLRRDMDVSTGVNKEMSGVNSVGRDIKALGMLQAKEAGLAKLKTGLDNVLWALSKEAELRWDLIQELNMTPESVEKMLDPKVIQEYLDEIGHNAQLFHHDAGEGAVYALRYPEIRANIKMNDQGVYGPSQQEDFFHVTPESIRWRGDITFTADAILASNKELNRQMKLDMINLLLPLLSQDPALMKKPAMEMLELYDETPEDWLPDSWLQAQAPTPAQPPTPEQPVQQPPEPGLSAPTQVPPESLGQGESSLANKMLGFLHPNPQGPTA